MGKARNQELVELIRSLKKHSAETKAAIWREVANCLGKSKRKRIAVNLSRINRYTSPGETVVVPGTVLGAGKLDHPIKIAAFRFSKQSKKKIAMAKGKRVTLPELMKENPKGSGIKIIG